LLVCSANAVEQPQAAYLNELIDQGDVQVRKVFYEYEQDKNVYKLIAALKAYNKPVRMHRIRYETALHISLFIFRSMIKILMMLDSQASSRDDNSESYEDDFEEDADEVGTAASITYSSDSNETRCSFSLYRMTGLLWKIDSSA